MPGARYRFARSKAFQPPRSMFFGQPRNGLVRDANDHFSDGAARFDVGDGLGRGLQRKGPVQNRFDDAMVHQRADFLQLLAARAHEEVLEARALFSGKTIDLAVEEPEDPDERQAQAPGARELGVGPTADG